MQVLGSCSGCHLSGFQDISWGLSPSHGASLGRCQVELREDLDESEAQTPAALRRWRFGAQEFKDPLLNFAKQHIHVEFNMCTGFWYEHVRSPWIPCFYSCRRVDSVKNSDAHPNWDDDHDDLQWLWQCSGKGIPCL
jgi:hypothetical protein